MQFVQLTENLGYAGNNNLGIKMAFEKGADWVFILNDDVVVNPYCLSTLIEFGQSDPTLGVLGPMVYHFDEPKVIQSAGGEFGKHWNSIEPGKNEVDHGQFKSPHL